MAAIFIGQRICYPQGSEELLQEIIQTPDQKFYAWKLKEYKFRIEYKIEASNRAADALLRRDVVAVYDEAVPSTAMIHSEAEKVGQALVAACHPVPDVWEILQREIGSTSDLIELRAALNLGRFLWWMA